MTINYFVFSEPGYKYQDNHLDDTQEKRSKYYFCSKPYPGGLLMCTLAGGGVFAQTPPNLAVLLESDKDQKSIYEVLFFDDVIIFCR